MHEIEKLNSLNRDLMSNEIFESCIRLWNERGYHCETIDIKNKRSVMTKALSFNEMIKTGKRRDRILISFEKSIKVKQL